MRESPQSLDLISVGIGTGGDRYLPPMNRQKRQQPMLRVQLVSPDGHTPLTVERSSLVRVATDNDGQVQEHTMQRVHHNTASPEPSREGIGSDVVYRYNRSGQTPTREGDRRQGRGKESGTGHGVEGDNEEENREEV